MSHPFFWPGKYFFYPVGNTSAVCLTRDLPPEERAHLLLLGCGDPRHVLYTIFSEPDNSPRKLDFTCVDIEPGVLARNVLIFSLISEVVPIPAIWNIFYHMYLDADTHTILIAQCKKLVAASASMEAWRASPYAAYVRYSTEYTLTEIRRYWSLYSAMPELSSRRQKAIREAFARVFEKQSTPMSSARSAGPLVLKALGPSADQALHYWKTGTTFSQQKDITAAKLMNPTFAYSLAGEGCAVHYGTDPLTTFHFAVLFGNSERSLTAVDMMQAAMDEFSAWCAAFFKAISNPTNAPHIRIFLAEATAACRALKSLSTAETPDLGVPTAQFRTQLIRLATEEYVENHAPASFNVIETSNLIDHVGLLNIISVAVPLMSSLPSSVLYTESLLCHGEDATKELTELLYADIGTMGLLFDLCPIDYLSGFTTRSNMHEIMMHRLLNKTQPQQSQFHQVTTWKSPASCDSVVALRSGRVRVPPVFHPQQLGTLLFDVYHAIFEHEDSMTFWKQNQQNVLRAIASSNIIHYMREGFVLLLRLVRERLRISKHQWDDVMDHFLDLEHADETMPMNTVNRNDFYAHLHRQGVHTVEYYRNGGAQRIGRFASWEVIPPVVRIVLSVPREKITAFEDVLQRTQVGTPILHCDIQGTWSLNTFCAIHVAYGRVIATGSKSNPRVVFEEDPEGRKGSLPLIVSFVVPAMLLTDIEPPQNLNVRLSVRSTPATMLLHAKFGLELVVFSTGLLDESHVHVLPEQQVPDVDDYFDSPGETIFSPNTTLVMEIGKQDAVVVDMDEQCELVVSVMARVNLEDSGVIRVFGSGATPELAQTSPCVMRLTVASRVQDVAFPFPVVESQSRLRLARKSRYIEIVVAPAGPFLKPDGMKLNPFPVVGRGSALAAWNVHRLVLNQLPLTRAGLSQWLNPHVGFMLSARERKLREAQKADGLLFIKDTLHAIFVRSAGIQGGAPMRVFALRDDTTNSCDTIFFISHLRYDLPSHTVVCDGYVLPLTYDVMAKIEGFFGELVHGGTIVNVKVFEGEMEAWKQLIPAFVERCRTWQHTDNCEYLASKQVPLTQKTKLDPLCSCGRGKDVGALCTIDKWSKYAPYVTRIALSPLFAVSYLETIESDPAAHKCSVCRRRGKPTLMRCKACQKVKYCSIACQKKDWPRHKSQCRA